MMTEYAEIEFGSDSVSVSFNTGNKKIRSIGKRMNEICEEAYMNGYNWEAFFNCYFEKNCPQVLDVIESDPEAGMYQIFINDTDEGAKKTAGVICKTINELFNNEEQIYSFLEENSEEIVWD